jgi:acyl-CoA thioesterase-1
MRMNFTRRAMVLVSMGTLTSLIKVAQAASPQTILVLGDSLSAEYGLPRGTGWVALLGQKLQADKHTDGIVNASVSGETTSGGRTRLPALLAQHKPNIVVIELGANDALRGLPLKATQDNLLAMIKLCQNQQAQVLLVGMQVPPNYGKRYTDDFAALYVHAAKDTRSALVPFMLAGVADRPDAKDWFQADGIHPLPKAHPIIRDLIWTGLKPLLLGR